MTASVRILTTSSVDSSPAILLVNADGSKILVNCGEGCQRSFLEHSQKLSTVKAVCLTHLRYDSLGGLPGMILTVSDAMAAAAMEEANSKWSASNSGNGSNAKDIQQQQQAGRPSNLNTNNTEVEPSGQDEVLPGLDLMGPRGINSFLHSLRHFMRRDKFKMHVSEGPCKTVEPSSKRKKKTKKKGAEEPPMAFTIQSISMPNEAPAPDQESSKKRPRPEDSAPETTATTETETAVPDQPMQQQSALPLETLSFLFTTPPVPGKFQPAKAAALGVPRGPLFAKLKAGKTVQFVDKAGAEQTVESHQVVDPPSPAVAVLVLNYPTLVGDGINGDGDDTTNSNKESLQQHADKVDRRDAFIRQVRETLSSKQAALDVVIHLVKSTETYPTAPSFWEQQLGPDTEHIFVPTQPENDWDGTPFRSAAVGAWTRSLLCPEIYHSALPPDSSGTTGTTTTTATTESTAALPYTIGRSMMEYALIPRARKGYGQLSLPSIQDDKIEAKKLAHDSGAVELSKQILQECNDRSTDSSPLLSNNTGEGELFFTGTGSALPCKHRNVTGMCLTMANGNSMLLDIGEGTVGQILRARAGDSNHGGGDDDKDNSSTRSTTADTLAKIRAVWISHPHADHHLGILRLLTERNAQDHPLLLLAPTSLFRFLREYESVDPEIQKSYIAIDCKDLVQENPQAVAQLQEALGVTGCRAVPVAHCAHSYAVVLDGTCFGRLVYSGDCRPSRELAQVGQGANVLIHEATFEDGMEVEAALKRHSTVGEALSVAHQMQAKCTILTHFSQRYPKIPPTPAQEQGAMPIIFAFDYMQLTPRTLHAASKLTPALRLLYPEEEQDTDGTKDQVQSPSNAQKVMSVPGLFAQSSLL
jgi:ribonuclease Z